jgi:hypothetical protein
VIWRNNKKLNHKQEQCCWMEASDNKKSDELKHKPNDELDLAHCWRDASNGSVAVTAGTKRSTNKALALAKKMVP